jgi:hypothetical protein
MLNPLSPGDSGDAPVAIRRDPDRPRKGRLSLAEDGESLT